jgi:hypothetical protein
MTDGHQEEGIGEYLSEEQKSEVAQLFHEALIEHMSEEEAEAYLVDLQEEEREIAPEQLFAHITQETSKELLVTSYHPDRAVREASLAKKAAWKRTAEGEISYTASNEFEVYFGAPLEISEALNQIRKLNESTVLTARIALTLWNSRRYNKQVSQEGSVAVLLDEFLQWQGIQKHSRQAHHGGTKRYTDGYRPEHRRRVQQDLALLAACQVRGTTSIILRGKSTQIQVDGPYLRFDTVSRRGPEGEEIVLGFLISPGGWIGTYEQNQNESLAQIDQRIFQLNPQNDRYALRLALYFTERWREQAKNGNFSEPITMTNLLNASMIDIDLKNLNKQAPAIEKALLHLQYMGILGKQVCLAGFHIGVKKNDEDWEMNTCMRLHRSSLHNQLDPCAAAPDTVVARWSKEWLASQWEVLPPLTLIQAYEGLKKKPGRRVPKRTQSDRPKNDEA